MATPGYTDDPNEPDFKWLSFDEAPPPGNAWCMARCVCGALVTIQFPVYAKCTVCHRERRYSAEGGNLDV